MTRWTVRILVGAALTAAALGITAIPAAAHVTVNPREAVQGGFAALTFRMPTERDNASSIKLEVLFPIEHPLASLSVKPQPGWSYKIERSKLPQLVKVDDQEITEAISKITWTAGSRNDAIGPGEFGEFQVSGGPMPEGVDQIVFKAIQYNDSGEVVRWIEEAAEGAPEPERPAPVLRLLPREQAEPTSATQPQQPGSHEETGNTLPITLSVVALAVALAAGLLSGLALRRSTPAGGDGAPGRADTDATG